MENSIEQPKGRFEEAEERTVNLKFRIMEIIMSKNKKVKRLKGPVLRDLWAAMEWINTMGVPEGEE